MFQSPFALINLANYIQASAVMQAEDEASKRMLQSVPPALVRQVLKDALESIVVTCGGIEFASSEQLQMTFDDAAKQLVVLCTANQGD